MKIEQRIWQAASGWTYTKECKEPLTSAQCVFIFGETSKIHRDISIRYEEIKEMYPKAILFGCSTAGEIAGPNVMDGSIVVTALYFDHTLVRTASVSLDEFGDSFCTGEALAGKIDPVGLRHVIVLSDGISINGSELVRGLTARLPRGLTITGGLAGDGDRFKETWVIGDSMPTGGSVAALGFYGEQLKVGYGSFGGWDPFGPERLITRSRGNVLYELDGSSALELYKRYLGEYAAGLPSTGLLFPLSVRQKDGSVNLVRTILAINESEQSMTFAGDVSEGSYARFMKANFDRVIDGAIRAADMSVETIGGLEPQFALLISCVGRKIVLKQRIEEEVEGVRDVLGWNVALTGFYSYGEIAPSEHNKPCELHNQTMTITVLGEI